MSFAFILGWIDLHLHICMVKCNTYRDIGNQTLSVKSVSSCDIVTVHVVKQAIGVYNAHVSVCVLFAVMNCRSPAHKKLHGSTDQRDAFLSSLPRSP